MTHKTPVNIDLDEAGVPPGASTVILYAIVQSGHIDNHDTLGELVVSWKTHHGVLKRRLFYHAHKQGAWSYNSENMIIPLDDMTTRSIEAELDGPPISGDSFKATVQLVSFTRGK